MASMNKPAYAAIQVGVGRGCCLSTRALQRLGLSQACEILDHLTRLLARDHHAMQQRRAKHDAKQRARRAGREPRTT
jgi:hypothetical protein